jgi:hypothetical protein
MSMTDSKALNEVRASTVTSVLPSIPATSATAVMAPEATTDVMIRCPR